MANKEYKDFDPGAYSADQILPQQSITDDSYTKVPVPLFGLTDNSGNEDRFFNANDHNLTIANQGESGAIVTVAAANSDFSKTSTVNFTASTFDLSVTDVEANVSVEIFGNSTQLFAQYSNSLTGNLSLIQLLETIANINAINVIFPAIQEFSTNADAIAAGLFTGALYHTAGTLKIVLP